MLGREVHTNFCADLVLEMQEPQKKTVSVKKCSDYANAFLWNYSFGLTMPGRSANIANPNDTYKFTGYERDDEAGLTLDYANARTYDPIIGRFLQVDPLFDDAMQVGLLPYNYSWNNPTNLTDPTGECPWCWGAVIGGGVEFIAQVGVGIASGQSFGESVRNVDYLDVIIAAGSGAVTGGLSSLAKTSTKVTVGTTANVAEGFLTETFDGDRNTIISMNSDADYSFKDVSVDALLGAGGEAASIYGKSLAQGTDHAASLSRKADRAERIAADGKPRTGQTNRAITARQVANDYGEGPVAQSTTATGTSVVSGAVNSGGNSQVPQQNNRFVSRPYVAQQDQTRVQLPNN